MCTSQKNSKEVLQGILLFLMIVCILFQEPFKKKITNIHSPSEEISSAKLLFYYYFSYYERITGKISVFLGRTYVNFK